MGAIMQISLRSSWSYCWNQTVCKQLSNQSQAQERSNQHLIQVTVTKKANMLCLAKLNTITVQIKHYCPIAIILFSQWDVIVGYRSF